MIDVSEHLTLEEAQFQQSRQMELLDISTIQSVKYEPEYSYLAESRNINDYFEINSINIEPPGQQRTIIFFEEGPDSNSSGSRNLASSRQLSSRRKIATISQLKHSKSTLHEPIRLPHTPRFLTFQLQGESEELCVGIIRQVQHVGEAPFFNGRGIKKGTLTYKVSPKGIRRQNISTQSENIDHNRNTLTSEDFDESKQPIIPSNPSNIRSISVDKSKYYQKSSNYYNRSNVLDHRSQRSSQSQFRDTASFLKEADFLISELNRRTGENQPKQFISERNNQTLQESMLSSVRSKRLTFAASQNPNTVGCVTSNRKDRKPGFIKTHRNKSKQEKRLSPLQIAIRERKLFPSVKRKASSKFNRSSIHKYPSKSISDIYIDKANQYNVPKKQSSKQSFKQVPQWPFSLEYYNKVDIIINHLSIVFEYCHFDKKYAELLLPPTLHKTSSQFGNHLVWTDRIYLFKRASISDYILITVRKDSNIDNRALGRTVVSTIDLLRHQRQFYYQTVLKDTHSVVAKVYLQFQLYKSGETIPRQSNQGNLTQADSQISQETEEMINPQKTNKIKNQKAKERILEKYIKNSRIEKLICPKLAPNQTRRYTGGNIKIGKAKRVTTEAIEDAPGPGEYNLPSTFLKHSSKQI